MSFLLCLSILHLWPPPCFASPRREASLGKGRGKEVVGIFVLPSVIGFLFFCSFFLSAQPCFARYIYAEGSSESDEGSSEADEGSREADEGSREADQESSEADERNSENSVQSEVVDVTCLNYPGVYEIWDRGSNRSYYGETTSLVRRFMQHQQGLENESYECKALLESFKNQNKQIENFRFLVHKSGPEWEDKQRRVDYELMLIDQNKDRCYNVEALSPEQQQLRNQQNIRRPLMYKETFYLSARDAAQRENIARSTVLRHVKSPLNPDVYYIETESFGTIPIFAKKEKGWSVIFPSMKDCVLANYASNVQNARRKIKRQEEGWRYAHVDEQNKPFRVPYTLKPGELSYEQYCEIFSFVFLIDSILERI